MGRVPAGASCAGAARRGSSSSIPHGVFKHSTPVESPAAARSASDCGSCRCIRLTGRRPVSGIEASDRCAMNDFNGHERTVQYRVRPDVVFRLRLLGLLARRGLGTSFFEIFSEVPNQTSYSDLMLRGLDASLPGGLAAPYALGSARSGFKATPVVDADHGVSESRSRRRRGRCCGLWE